MVQSVYLAYANDQSLRYEASSGGFCKAYLSYLLDSHIVDKVIITRTLGLDAETVVTANKQDFLTPRANSVYIKNSPLAVRDQLKADEAYAITLLPCDVRRLRLLQKDGQLSNIKIAIGLLCNHVPQKEWTLDILQSLGIDPADVVEISYRGRGWPGKIVIKTKAREVELRLQDVWRNDMGRVEYRCRKCDLLVPESDIVVADPWFNNNRSVGAGKTMVLFQSEQSLAIAKEASSYLTLEPFTEEEFNMNTSALKRTKYERSTNMVLARRL